MNNEKRQIETFKFENKTGFRYTTGSSILFPMEEDKWFNYIQKLYVTLLTYDNKNGNMYKGSLEVYNAICKEFNFKTI